MTNIITNALSIMLILLLAISNLTYAQSINDDSTPVYIVIANNTDDEASSLAFSELKSDVPAYIAGGTTMIPLRALAEGFGYDVEFQERNKKIIIRDAAGDNELIFTIGSTTALRNGQADNMLQAPLIRDASTFLPLRYVSEFFDKYVTWRKGIDGKTMFIWISSVQLLTDDDVAAERDDINYYDEALGIHPVPYYVLKNDGQTNRGMRIGDSYEKVIELYGEPHEKKYKDGELHAINYYTERLSYLVGGSVLNIYFTNGNVEYVGIDGRW